jgi:hypothetical protein
MISFQVSKSITPNYITPEIVLTLIINQIPHLFDQLTGPKAPAVFEAAKKQWRIIPRLSIRRFDGVRVLRVYVY